MINDISDRPLRPRSSILHFIGRRIWRWVYRVERPLDEERLRRKRRIHPPDVPQYLREDVGLPPEKGPNPWWEIR